MATKKQIQIRGLGIYGVIRQAEVDDYLVPDGAVVEAINVQFDRKGAVSLRQGITGLGATIAAGYPCWGLHNTQNGTMVAVFSQGGSSRIYAYGGASWASNLTGGTANVKVRFFEFANKTVAVNWGNASNQYSSMLFWSGSPNVATWLDSGNPINPQNLWSNGIYPQYAEVHKARVYVVGDPTYPDRLFYSEAVDSSGNITWIPATSWVDISPNDGEHISALKRFSLELIVFKPNYIYRFRTTGVDPDPLIKIGTRSQEGIVEGKQGLYFHHDTGFYCYNGSYPREISRPISDIVNAIPFTSFANIVAWRDSDRIYWSVGNITVNGEAWKNVVCRYTESSQVWTIYTLPYKVNFAKDYNSGSTLTRLIACEDGTVYTFNSGTTDSGEPIKYRMVTKWYDFGDLLQRKTILRVIGVCEKAQETILMYQTNDNDEWKTMGQIKKFLTDFDDLAITCHRIRFKITGMSKSEPFVFLGLIFPDLLPQGTTIEK